MKHPARPLAEPAQREPPSGACRECAASGSAALGRVLEPPGFASTPIHGLRAKAALRTMGRMERTALDSSVVLSAGYDAADRVLELEFVSGRVYRYDGVPEGTYQWLLRTPSKGNFVTRMINERYIYREVDTPSPDTPTDLVEALRASLRETERETEGASPGGRPADVTQLKLPLDDQDEPK